MNSTTKNKELTEAIERLVDLYQEAVYIIDIKGDEYIEKHLNEDDAELFKELVETLFDYYDVLDTVDIDDIDDWFYQLEEYLDFF